MSPSNLPGLSLYIIQNSHPEVFKSQYKINFLIYYQKMSRRTSNLCVQRWALQLNLLITSDSSMISVESVPTYKHL